MKPTVPIIRTDGLWTRVHELLEDRGLLTLAITDGRGQPHAATLHYACEDPKVLYIYSSPATVHGRALSSGALVAGTVVDATRPLHRALGLQFRAIVQPVAHDVEAAVLELYLRSLPSAVRTGDFMRLLTHGHLWSLTLRWLKLTDKDGQDSPKPEWYANNDRSFQPA